MHLPSFHLLLISILTLAKALCTLVSLSCHRARGIAAVRLAQMSAQFSLYMGREGDQLSHFSTGLSLGLRELLPFPSPLSSSK